MPAEELGSKVIVDATRRWTYPAISLPPRHRIQQVADNWEAYGLPPLDEVRLPKAL
jgi:4-hydroxy-3-polyprenylbenzoate decarboxylase